MESEDHGHPDGHLIRVHVTADRSFGSSPAGGRVKLPAFRIAPLNGFPAEAAPLPDPSPAAAPKARLRSAQGGGPANLASPGPPPAGAAGRGHGRTHSGACPANRAGA